MSDHPPIIERIYPIADWRADARGILRALGAEVTPQSATRGSPRITAYCEDVDGTPDAISPTQIRIVVTWTPYLAEEIPDV
jgi:hypothetical protein